MPLIPLLPLFHNLNRVFFDNLLVKEHQPKVSVRWSDGRLTRTAGFYRRSLGLKGVNKCEIVISSPILGDLPVSAVKSTLCHEMIHAWTDLILGVKEVHGFYFHKKMNLINSLQDDFIITVRHDFPVKLKTSKWIAICPNCGICIKYKRFVRGVACKKCCDSYHAGKWTSKYMLHYESLSTMSKN